MGKDVAMRSLPMVIVLGVAAGAAVGAELEVHQADRKFAPSRIVVAKGGAVQFVNDENVIHHAFVDTPQFVADTGDIPPGDRRNIVFTKAGFFSVYCAIHPQMQMLVEVTE